MLAQFTYFKLDLARKADVLSLVDHHLTRLGAPRYGSAPGSMRPFWHALLMLGMHGVGIEPALDGERWPLPDDCRLQRPPLDQWSIFPRRVPRIFWIADRLALDFRIYDEATEEARRDLIAVGVDLVEAEGDPLDDVHHYMGGGFGKPVTWREWWRSKA